MGHTLILVYSVSILTILKTICTSFSLRCGANRMTQSPNRTSVRSRCSQLCLLMNLFVYHDVFIRTRRGQSVFHVSRRAGACLVSGLCRVRFSSPNNRGKGGGFVRLSGGLYPCFCFLAVGGRTARSHRFHEVKHTVMLLRSAKTRSRHVRHFPVPPALGSPCPKASQSARSFFKNW